MNPTQPLSPFLKVMVDTQTLSLKVAEVFNALNSPDLQHQAVLKWSEKVDQAAHELCAELTSTDPQNVKVLYDSRTTLEAPVSSSDFRRALTEDILDSYFPYLGRVGWVLRDRISGGWQSQKNRLWWKWALGLWLVSFFWRPIFWVGSVPFHAVGELWTHVQTPLNPQPETRNLPAGRQDSKPGTVLPPEVPVAKKPAVAVQAVQVTRILPPVPAGLYPPPGEVHAEVRTPDLIYVGWRAVAKNARYNVYSSASRDLTHLRKENAVPLTSNLAEWNPETGLDRYWLVVTTLDDHDQESAHSEAIEVVRYPEKS